MSPGALTRDRDFLKLWGGQAISKIGSTITSVGLPLTAAFVLGASPLQMGILADVTGPGLTGLLVQLITAPMAILLDALSFLCSAVSVWMIRKPEPLPEPSLAPHIGREIAEGLAASWRNPLLRALLQRAATSAFFGGLMGGLYFLFAVRELHITTVLLGIVISVGGAR